MELLSGIFLEISYVCSVKGELGIPKSRNQMVCLQKLYRLKNVQAIPQDVSDCESAWNLL